MSSKESDVRIARIEERLAKLEELLTQRRTPASGPDVRPGGPGGSPALQAVRVQPSTPAGGDSAVIGSILGWGGAIALVLAASYLIRLAIDSGWLTPLRQIAFAAVFGLVLIGTGFALKKYERRYAGLLPAAGIAILFLTIYGGHLYYHLLGPFEAGIAVGIVCAASLWLSRSFESDLYAFFAVAGSYSAPYLLAGVAGSMTDIAIYYSAWSVVFCIFAVWHGRRTIYLLAVYLALIGFDVLWRGWGQGPWTAALAFQVAQFTIFGIATAVYSVRHEEPLDRTTALAHLPPLLIFYFLQYNLLDRFLPFMAPWIAVGSFAAVAILYAIARYGLQQELPGGELLLWSYAALVLFHAGYVEALPKIWAPWFACLLVPFVALASIRTDEGVGARWPIWIATGMIFALNYLRVIFDTDLYGVPARAALAVAYAVLLYLGYWFCRRQELFGTVAPLLLFAGHISAMAAALHVLREPIVESAVWGLIAVAWLGWSLKDKDKLMGQSSLALFGAAAMKVLLYDLRGAAPIARIIGLLVLGATFYLGGLLYQRLLGKGNER
jgi:uncharacterized membrane protein